MRGFGKRRKDDADEDEEEESSQENYEEGDESDFVRTSDAEHRALIEVGGHPLLIHVLRALRAQPLCGPIGVCTDALGERLATSAMTQRGIPAPERLHPAPARPGATTVPPRQ